MENLDNALIREDQAAASRNAVIAPVVVKTINDIKRLVAELNPDRNPVSVDIPLSTTIKVQEDNRSVIYKVDAKTRSKSRRDILIEGLSIIKNRIDFSEKIKATSEPVEVNGVEMKPAAFGDGVLGTSWVDSLIKQWFGGYRDGITICWTLNDGFVYKYDIWQHRLSRVSNEK